MPPYWRLSFEAGAEAEALEDTLAPLAVSTARFEAAPGRWRVEALCEAEPEEDAVARLLAAAGSPIPAFDIERLPDQDWLALNRRQFPPVTAGRFFIHGSYFEGVPPAGKLVVRLDAGPAFGSGTHETTRGCLLAIDGLLAEGVEGPALDLGCGSGILALAMARAGLAVTATDNDPQAVATARANAAANGLGDLVMVHEEAGVSGAGVAASAPYGLISANILAEPLIALAPGLAARLALGGRLVLSGLLAPQEPEVTAAYRAVGLSRRDAVRLGDWSTLVLVRES